MALSTIGTNSIANDAVTKDKITGINVPAFKALRGSAQTISDETSTVVIFDTEIYDTDSAYDNSNGIFTVPSGKGGKYLITVTGGINSSADINATNFWISKNNQTAISTTTGQSAGIEFKHDGNPVQNQAQQVAGQFTLAATDTIRIYTWQNYGGNRDLATGGRMIVAGFRIADE